MTVKYFLNLALASTMMIPGFAFPKSEFLPVDADKIQNEFKEVNSASGGSGNSYSYDSSPSQIECRGASKDLNDLLVLKKDQVKSFLAMDYYINLFSENSTYIGGSLSSQSFTKTNLAFKEEISIFNKIMEIFDKNFPQTMMELTEVDSYYQISTARENVKQFQKEIMEFSESLASNDQSYNDKSYRRQYRVRTVVNALTSTISKGNYSNFFSSDKNCGINLMEFKSLFLYTGSGSYYMAKQETAPELKKFFTPLEKNMVSLLRKLKPEARAVRIGTYLNKSEWEKIIKDGQISYGGFISGSVNNSYGAFAKNVVIKVVKNKTGSLISSFSAFQSEGEVIWYKPTFKIKSAVTDSRGKLWLEAEEM